MPEANRDVTEMDGVSRRRGRFEGSLAGGDEAAVGDEQGRWAGNTNNSEATFAERSCNCGYGVVEHFSRLRAERCPLQVCTMRWESRRQKGENRNGDPISISIQNACLSLDHKDNAMVKRTVSMGPGFLLFASLLASTVQGLPATGTHLQAQWPTSFPEKVGLDSSVLAEMFDYVQQHRIPVHSVQIVRHGRLHDVASVTKSITSTLIGLAIQKGNLRNVHQPMLGLFADRVAANLDKRKQQITLEHLLTMQAGWDCGFEPREARLFEMRRSPDWLQFMLDLPMVADPGTHFAYCSGNPYVLSIILSKTTGTNALAFARRELFEPLGIYDVSWPTDPNGYNHG